MFSLDKRRKYFKELLIGIPAMAVILFIVSLFSERSEHMIKIHKKVVPAKVKYVRRKCLYMKYKIGNKEIEECFGSPKPECNVVGSELLIVFDSLDIDNSRLLILPEDFKKFNLNFPDSLSWTKDCFHTGLRW